MGWDQNNTEDDDESFSIEEINAICESAADDPLPEPNPEREGIDWIRTEDGHLCHPLQHRCSESALKFFRQADKLGLEDIQDTDLDQFIFEFQTTAARLAGALNGIARGQDLRDAAFTVAYLKRALDHLHKSQSGLEAAAQKKLLPEAMLSEARKELLEIREGILRLMDEFRRRG
jgi:hypothetical protein